MNPLLRAGTLIAAMLTAQLGVSGASAAEHAVTRRDLVGTWRLLRIEYVGPRGPERDPFYGDTVTGLLLYDPSGYMSVQIVGAPRPKLGVPDARPTPPEVVSREATTYAGVLDTYMAYFGTWQFDAKALTVIHHVESSLIPSESGTSYTQAITLRGRQLIFSNRTQSPQGVVVRRKIWERVRGPAR